MNIVRALQEDVKQVRHQLDNREREEITQQLNVSAGQHSKLMNDDFQCDHNAYSLPMQRLLKRTESIFTARPRTFYEPSMIFSDEMSDHVWLGNDSATEHSIDMSPRVDPSRLAAVHESTEELKSSDDGGMMKEYALAPIVDVDLVRAESRNYWQWEKKRALGASH